MFPNKDSVDDLFFFLLLKNDIIWNKLVIQINFIHLKKLKMYP